MSADERIAALHRATAANTGLAEAVKHYGACLPAMRAATDEIEVAQHLARVILAAEAVKDAAAGIVDQGRVALAAWFGDTGCPALRTETHTVSVTEPKPAPRVIDAAALPPTMLVPQPPKPDMAAIKAAVERGQYPPGVVIANGAPYISFRKRT